MFSDSELPYNAVDVYVTAVFFKCELSRTLVGYYAILATIVKDF